jgi:hypothetical protein
VALAGTSYTDSNWIPRVEQMRAASDAAKRRRFCAVFVWNPYWR